MIIRINESEGIVTLEWANHKEIYCFDKISCSEDTMAFFRKGLCLVEIPLAYGVRVYEGKR